MLSAFNPRNWGGGKHFGAAENVFLVLDLSLNTTFSWYAESATLQFVLE